MLWLTSISSLSGLLQLIPTALPELQPSPPQLWLRAHSRTAQHLCPPTWEVEARAESHLPAVCVWDRAVGRGGLPHPSAVVQLLVRQSQEVVWGGLCTVWKPQEKGCGGGSQQDLQKGNEFHA